LCVPTAWGGHLELTALSSALQRHIRVHLFTCPTAAAIAATACLYPAAWGGHLELTALSSALQRHIRVHAVGMDTISLGENARFLYLLRRMDMLALILDTAAPVAASGMYIISLDQVFCFSYRLVGLTTPTLSLSVSNLHSAPWFVLHLSTVRPCCYMIL
jgi:hypothetical protein